MRTDQNNRKIVSKVVELGLELGFTWQAGLKQQQQQKQRAQWSLE